MKSINHYTKEELISELKACISVKNYYQKECTLKKIHFNIHLLEESNRVLLGMIDRLKLENSELKTKLDKSKPSGKCLSVQFKRKGSTN